MLWLYRYILGYLLVEFSGDYSEQILNLTANNGITMWNLRCHKRSISGCIAIANFKQLRPMIRGTGIHVHILKKMGFPFFAHKYEKRFGFLLGAVIFFLFIQFLSGFIWTINVAGNSKVAAEEILASCNQIGIHEGVYKGKIDTRIGTQKLLLKTPALAWASLNVEGCVLTVNVSEIKNPVSKEETLPSNLKSSADGIVKKIQVESGNVVVKVGDAVHSGDLLVSGIIERMSSTVFVRSKGSVIAQTQRVLRATGTYDSQIRVKTGKVRKHSVLEFFGIKIPLYIGKVKGDFDSSVSCNRVKLFEKKLPISLTTRTFEMTGQEPKHYTKEQLTELLRESTVKQLKDLGVNEFEIKSEQIIENEKGLTLERVIISQENVVKEDKILFNSPN